MANYSFTEDNIAEIKSGIKEIIIAGVFLFFISLFLFFIGLIPNHKSPYSVVLYITYILLSGSITGLLFLLYRRINNICRYVIYWTNEDKNREVGREAELYEKLATLEEAKKEHIEKMIRRVQAEKQLEQITSGGSPPAPPVPPHLEEIYSKLENVKNYQEIEEIIAREKEKYPQQEEVLDVIRDEYRERLLRKRE